MDKAEVYFTDLRCPPGQSQLTKLQRLIRAAGIGDIDFEKKLVAIKMHFGEPGNLAYLRPNWAKAVADVVKELGGHPFLTDCNTLYVGRRKNALDHLDAACENGFNPMTTGCQIVIGDGLKGTDEAYVSVAGGEYVKEAKIGRAVMDADVFLSLSHFKGHESTGFGGAIKNVGMGCGSRAGKMEQHSAGKPVVDPAACRKCRACARSCGQDAVAFDGPGGAARIDQDRCVGCGRCIGACNFDAIGTPDGESNTNTILDYKMAEYAKAVVDGRPQFHISLVIDVSPLCDCYGGNDAPILPDVGMFASFDMVALDQACVDACLAQSPIPGSVLDERLHAEGFRDHHDHFKNAEPESEWRACLEHAEKIGLGTRRYELITVK